MLARFDGDLPDRKERMQLWLDTLFQKKGIKMDYYKILGINEQADEEQIKQAYRRLAKKYHPDLNPDNPEAEAKFKNVVEAYETLGDTGKRREYDLKRKGSGGQGRHSGKGTAKAPDMNINFGNFTKDMEKYFGFSFAEKGSGSVKNGGGEKKNPLDVTDMFEAFMKIK